MNVPASSPVRPARQFRRASLQTGAYELIPLPFVDDWLIGRQRRSMVRMILEARGLTCDKGVPRLLAGGSRTLFGRARTMAKNLVLKPFRKVFRSVFFWLIARRAARTAVETYFLARFLHYPDLAGGEGSKHLTVADALRLAAVFTEVSRNIDLRAAGSTFGRVRKMLKRRGPENLGTGEMQRAIEEEDPGFIAEFDRLVSRRVGEGPAKV